MSHGGRYTIHLKGLPQGVSTEDFVVESAFLESRPTFDLSGGPVVCTIRVDRVGAVSYTHLDVYKRQLLRPILREVSDLYAMPYLELAGILFLSHDAAHEG